VSTEVVYWEDDETKERNVKRYCAACQTAHGRFDIVSPAGTAHFGDEHQEGETQCGIDARGDEWWWRV
jgi:hypothetical protein